MKGYPMLTSTKKIVLALLILAVPIMGIAHDGSYEMTIDNFVKHYPEMSIYDITLEAICIERDTYKEIILVMKDEQGDIMGRFIEFNNAFPNAGYFDGKGYYNYQYDPQKHYDATAFNWLTTVGFRSKNCDYIWHQKPYNMRWSKGIGIIDRIFFEDIIRDGKFEVFFENHQLKWNSQRDVHTGKRTVYVKNPEAFEEFLKVPITSYLPFEFRRKLRSVINILSFDSFFYDRLRRN
jgi:hypothetical protein